VAPANIQPANALRGLTFSLSNVVGPVLAGVLIADAGGPGAALVLDAATFAVSLVLLTPLRPRLVADDLDEEQDRPPRVESFGASLRAGWAEVRSRHWVLGFLGGFTVYHAIVLPAIFVVGPVLMASDYQGARSWALITALFGIGNIVGDLLLLAWKPRHALRVAAFMLAGASCQAAIIGSGLSALSIGFLELLTGICVTGAFTLWETTLGEHIPGGSLSRVASYDYLSSTGVIPLGNVLIGVSAAAIGLHASLWAMSIVGVGAAAVVASLRSVRRLPRGTAGIG
jgi:hypothetical protein